MGIFAHYSKNGTLLSASIAKINEDDSAHSIKNPYTPSKGEYVKFMMWTKEDLHPVSKVVR